MTTAVDLLTVAWRALDADEREESYARIHELHSRDAAGHRGEMERLLEGLRVVADRIGDLPSPAAYDRERKLLAAEGVDIAPRSQVTRRFNGSWRQAKEGLSLYLQPSKVTTARRIEARFASRRRGKVWRYRTEALAEAMAAAVAYWNRPPLVAEFEHWRERELELARARGDEDAHIPSTSPYRKRWGSWEASLLALGYSTDDVDARPGHHERRRAAGGEAPNHQRLNLSDMGPVWPRKRAVLGLVDARSPVPQPERSRSVLLRRLRRGLPRATAAVGDVP